MFMKRRPILEFDQIVHFMLCWKNISVHQEVKILKEKNQLSIDVDPYCCKITINRADRINDITVGHKPRKLSRLAFFFIPERGSVTSVLLLVLRLGCRLFQKAG